MPQGAVRNNVVCCRFFFCLTQCYRYFLFPLKTLLLISHVTILLNKQSVSLAPVSPSIGHHSPILLSTHICMHPHHYHNEYQVRQELARPLPCKSIPRNHYVIDRSYWPMMISQHLEAFSFIWMGKCFGMQWEGLQFLLRECTKVTDSRFQDIKSGQASGSFDFRKSIQPLI